MNKHKSLLVIWKNKQTKLYYHIGTLSFDGSIYSFQYTNSSQSNRNVHLAINEGYKLHPAFPFVNKIYESERLFETFNQRIPSQSRVGYSEFLESYGLNKNADRMDILQATRGVLANDSYSFEQPLKLHGEDLRASFFINGMRHIFPDTKDWVNYVSEGEQLVVKLDANPIDPYALKVYTKSDKSLGFIPGIYAQALHALVSRGVSIEIKVKKMRPDFASQWWIEVNFHSKISMDDAKNLEETNLYNVIEWVAA